MYNNYHTITKSNIIKFNTYNNINSYITGLLEGDGYIKIISEDYKSKNKNSRFVFTFHINNLDLFNEFKNFIDSGYFIKGSNKTMRFIIADIKGVIKLVNLINGYFRTPKIITFHKLIDILNKKYSLNIIKLPIDNSSLDSNA
jgi:LAGLIDADG endonuclease